jgi:hypothetical protein
MNSNISGTPSTGTFVELQAGHSSTCGRLDAGNVICWGKDEYAQTSTPKPPTVLNPILPTQFSQPKRYPKCQTHSSYLCSSQIGPLAADPAGTNSRLTGPDPYPLYLKSS